MEHDPGREIDIWYMSGMSLCNFDCAYCAAGIPEQGGERSRKAMWLTPDGADTFHRILARLAALPYRFGLRLQTIGEPFVSDELLAGVAFMTRQDRVRFVEMVSNGSLLERRLLRIRDEHGGDLDKISIWTTFHHTQITAAELVANAAFAQRHVKQVVVNALLFPDNAAQIDELHRLCRSHGSLALNVDPGYNHNVVFDTGILPLLDLDPERAGAGSPARLDLLGPRSVVAANLIAALDPRGQPCSAGHDYVFVNPRGDVYPCLGYSRQLAGTRLGNVLDDDFALALRDQAYAPCGIDSGCLCKEDFLHLAIARPHRDNTASLGTVRMSARDTLDDATRERLRDLLTSRSGGRTFLRVL